MRIAAALALALSPSAPAEDDHEFFESKIRPLLEARCLECHRGPAEKGGLSLDSAAGWQRGGDGGAVIAPGDAESSRLIAAVRYRDQVLRMPPDARLPAPEIALLEEWVRRGAPDPRTAPSRSKDARSDETGSAAKPRPAVDLERARAEHWSFRPIASASAPQVANASWPADELDRFVLARLESAGLQPSAPAEKRVLLRRASFDLLGLPPTPEELESFLADEAPDAWERVVERLLASPHYGERWGRRWLDLARYADSNGLDENLALGHAWRYRDYVVRAWNQDKPYDRFVMEQLAGDLLPPPSDPEQQKEQLTATGFLVLGPKMLAEQDKEKLVMDVIDEQLDVAGKAFLGLSLGCARCHDHKFDPIPQRDYYALAGIFRSTSTMANLDHVSRWREVALATSEEQAAAARWRSAEEEARAAIERVANAAHGALGERIDRRRGALLDAGSQLASAALTWQAEDRAASERLLVDRDQWGSVARPILRSADPSRAQHVEYSLALPRAGRWQLWAEYASADKRPLALAIDGARALATCCGAATGGFHLQHQRWELLGEIELGAGAHRFRFEAPAGQAFPHLDRFVLLGAADPKLERALAEATRLPREVLRNAARHFATADAREPLLAPWRAWQSGGVEALRALASEADLFAPYRALIADPLPRDGAELAARADVLFATVERSARAERARQPQRDEKSALLADPDLERLRHFLEMEAGPFRLARAAAESAFEERERTELAALRARREALERERPRDFDVALGVAEDKPVDLPIHLRGNHMNLGPQRVPRGFLEVFRPALPDAAPAPEHSGRLELARWLVDPRHPLTARVLVNRVWQGHFGAGLVRTASDFGLRGEAPTHPELLDALARDFVAGGWSVKALHRRILRSATYRMSSAWSTTAAAVDPQERLLWRFPRQRLDAETLRDALLTASGGLDRTTGGTLLDTKNGDYVTNDQSNNAARYAQPRRSLYLPIIRNAIYELFATFDYNDPSVPVDRRPSTVVAHQALWALNSPLVQQESRRLAERLLDPAAAIADEVRLVRAYERLFARSPSAEESASALAFLAETKARTAAALDARGSPDARAWSLLLQSLFASSEFLYVD